MIFFLDLQINKTSFTYKRANIIVSVNASNNNNNIITIK